MLSVTLGLGVHCRRVRGRRTGAPIFLSRRGQAAALFLSRQGAVQLGQLVDAQVGLRFEAVQGDVGPGGGVPVESRPAGRGLRRVGLVLELAEGNGQLSLKLLDLLCVLLLFRLQCRNLMKESIESDTPGEYKEGEKSTVSQTALC